MPRTSISTAHCRRHYNVPLVEELGFVSRFVSGSMKAVPATAVVAPRPFGDLSTADADHIAELTAIPSTGTKPARYQRRSSARMALDYLAGFPGDTWQERWDASPVGLGEIRAAAFDVATHNGAGMTTGVRGLLSLRVIQPTMLAFRRQGFNGYSTYFVAAQNDPLLNKYVDHVHAHDLKIHHKHAAIWDLCGLLTVQGVGLADVTPEAILHFGHESRLAFAEISPGKKANNRFAGRASWNVLHQMGHFPPSTPHTMREAMHRGQQTVTELIDRYPIENQAVRQLLIDYCTRRKADTDYGTLTQLVLNLVSNFWCKIEKLNPGQADLCIAPEVYTAWREQIAVLDDGRPRATADTIVIGVRSFYHDLHTWAVEEPERWAVWVAPNPVPPSEIRGLAQRRRRINDRSADRTRVRQPLLPTLVAHVEGACEHYKQLLSLAAELDDNQTCVLNGRTYERFVGPADQKHRQRGHDIAVRVKDTATGELIHVTKEEETAFWNWATVETLRHSGVRVEEMSELTHLSIRQYQRANGEVIALLVVAPSKTDRERVIPMSAELFHVIASIIRRHTRDGRPIHLLRRFDQHEKTWSTPLPYLFQQRQGSTQAVIALGTTLGRLRRVCDAIGKHNPGFRGLRFTPHDFRRIFATELVNSGLPIHIGAALLGHLNIQTTRGYVAVFDEDVVRHYQTHLQHRREIRPDEEYVPVTAEEWTEFEEHFDKRKVELGSCARPYGTGCQHEHACIRCPMLNVNPKMIDRLGDLEQDLLARRARAEAENWLGEIEGIDLTLSFLRTKRQQAERQVQRPPVHLGLPQPREATS